MDATMTMPAPTATAVAPDLTPQDRANELLAALYAAIEPDPGDIITSKMWLAARVAASTLPGYSPVAFEQVGEYPAWAAVYRAAEQGYYRGEVDAQRLADARAALAILAAARARLMSPAGCADFEGWCRARGASWREAVAAAWAEWGRDEGYAPRNGYRPGPRSDG